MKKIKLITALIPVSIVCSALPLVSTTSCNKKSDEDTPTATLEIDDQYVAKQTIGIYEEAFAGDTMFFGFKLDEKHSLSDLKVNVINLQGFDGTVTTSITTSQVEVGYFDVTVSFSESTRAIPYLTPKFDLEFSCDHQTITKTGFEITEFTQQLFRIRNNGYSTTQKAVTMQTGETITYTVPTSFYFTANNKVIDQTKNLEVIIDQSVFSQMSIKAELVPDKVNTKLFYIKFTVSNFIDYPRAWFNICLKHKWSESYLWRGFCNFSVSTSQQDCFEYKVTSDTEAEITSCNCSDDEIIVPSTASIDGKTYNVTSVASYGLQNKHVRKYTLPDTLGVLNAYAIANCPLLEEINIPKNVYDISNVGVFKDCYLTDITVDSENSKYTSIVDGKETHCVISKPTNGECHLIVSSRLMTEIPNTVTHIDEGVFTNFEFDKITIPDSVYKIGIEAFKNCKQLSSVNFGENSALGIIDERAFVDCQSLTSFDFPSKTQYMNSDAFMGCSLKEIHISAKLKLDTIHSDFVNAGQLEKVTVDPNHEYLTSKGLVDGSEQECNCIINKTNKTLLTATKNTVIPTDIETLGVSCYEYANFINDFVVPTNITTISGAAFKHSTIRSFKSDHKINFTGNSNLAFCTNLEKVEFDNVTSWGNDILNGCTKLTTIDLSKTTVTDISMAAFLGCTALKSIVLPNTITHLRESCFKNCSSLETITIPATVTDMADECFKDCWSLKTVDFSSCGLTEIGENAFEECESLEEVKNMPSNLEKINESAFEECYSLKTISFPNTLKEIGLYGFYKCYALTEVDLSGTQLTSISAQSFQECTSLETVKLPDTTLTNIGASAFRTCLSLNSINIPSACTQIGMDAFATCTSLTKIVLPDGLKTIGNNAFEGDLALAEINLSKVETIGSSAFSECSVLKNPDLTSLTSMGDFAFERCTSLTSVTFGSSLTTIPFGAFYESKIVNLTIPTTITTIKGEAFLNATLDTVTFAKTDNWYYENESEQIADLGTSATAIEVLHSGYEIRQGQWPQQ